MKKRSISKGQFVVGQAKVNPTFDFTLTNPTGIEVQRTLKKSGELIGQDQEYIVLCAFTGNTVSKGWVSTGNLVEDMLAYPEAKPFIVNGNPVGASDVKFDDIIGINPASQFVRGADGKYHFVS